MYLRSFILRRLDIFPLISCGLVPSVFLAVVLSLSVPFLSTLFTSQSLPCFHYSLPFFTPISSFSPLCVSFLTPFVIQLALTPASFSHSSSQWPQLKGLFRKTNVFMKPVRRGSRPFSHSYLNCAALCSFLLCRLYFFLPLNKNM